MRKSSIIRYYRHVQLIVSHTFFSNGLDSKIKAANVCIHLLTSDKTDELFTDELLSRRRLEKLLLYTIYM